MNGADINMLQLKDYDKALQVYRGHKGDIWKKSQVTLTPGNHKVRQ